MKWLLLFAAVFGAVWYVAGIGPAFVCFIPVICILMAGGDDGTDLRQP